MTFGEGDYKEPIVNTYKQYLSDHSEIFKGREDKFVCLMDLALMAMRKLKKEGKLADQKRTIRAVDRLPLLFVQCIINAHN